MNIIIRVSIFCFLFVMGYSSVEAQAQHVGLWKGIDKGEIGHVSIDDSGYSYFIFESDTLGGESFLLGGLECYMKCEVSYGDPLNLIDFVIYSRNDDQVYKKLLGLFKFDGDDKIILYLSFGEGDRPSYFMEEQMIELKRVASVMDKK